MICRRFIFGLPDGQSSMLPVASCIVVKSSDPEALKDSKGKPIIRPYTPVSHPDLPGELHLLIKKYDAGNASKHIHSLKEGDTLAIKGPIPKFPYKSTIIMSLYHHYADIALKSTNSMKSP